MTTFKRLFALSLCLILTLAFCACGKQEAEPETTTVDNTVTVTFHEGITVLEAAELLEKKGVCSAADFEEVCKTIPEGYDKLLSGTTTENRIFALEGYIFPDTYEFYKGEDASSVVTRFLDNMDSKLTDDMYEQAESMGFVSMDQLITFASVIQAEASDADEMPNVAGVFYNRLVDAANFPYLGSDVTRQYIDTKMKDYITESGLDYDALFASYNTNDGYDNKTQGLPTGPICNPGLDAIQAALNPATTEYYYFFTDPDGGYHYFATLSEFQTAWAKLQYSINN